ncbi:MAG: hypothetical protein OEL79_08870 [Chromatiales bacterium]|nr:hypothetical protein [Chromatiales bacterium]
MLKKTLMAILCLTVATSYATDLPQEVKLTTDGDEITVSMYKLNEPLIIKPLYEPRDDLDAYPWFRPLLFTLNAYALSIPKDEWTQYGEGDWSQARYDGIEKAMIRTKQACIENPDTWGNKAMYNELDAVALCKVDGTTYLVFKLTGKKMDGTVFGGRSKRLKLVEGEWVNPHEPEISRKRAKQLNQCFKEVMSLVEKGELASIPISELK